MALTEKVYSIKMARIMQLAWDIDKFRLGIQSRNTVPNPHCEDLLDEACKSMKALLIQMKKHNVDSDGNSLNDNERWWYPDIEKESMEKTQLA